MVSPNWSLLNMNGPMGGFQNALAQGYQIGSDMRQRREATERRNALAAYGQNPNEKTLAGVMQSDPQTGIALQDRMAQQRQQAEAQRREQASQFRRLLAYAGEDVQSAMQAAQGMGIDLSGVPQPGSPEFEPWRQSQMMIYSALENIDQQELTTLQQNVMAALPPDQRDPNGPAFVNAMQRALIDWQTVQPGGQISGQNPVSGNIENMAVPGYGPQGGTPRNGQPAAMSANDFSRIVQGFDGDAARAARYTQENNVAVQINSEAEADMLPPGTRIILNGRPGTVQ